MSRLPYDEQTDAEKKEDLAEKLHFVLKSIITRGLNQHYSLRAIDVWIKFLKDDQHLQSFFNASEIE